MTEEHLTDPHNPYASWRVFWRYKDALEDSYTSYGTAAAAEEEANRLMCDPDHHAVRISWPHYIDRDPPPGPEWTSVRDLPDGRP